MEQQNKPAGPSSSTVHSQSEESVKQQESTDKQDASAEENKTHGELKGKGVQQTSESGGSPEDEASLEQQRKEALTERD